MIKNILITEGENYSKKALELYSEKANLFIGEGIPPEDVHVLIVRLGLNLNEEYLSNYPNLSYLVSPTTGLTHIDLDFCLRKGIKVISLNDIKDQIQLISSTAELTLGLIISLVRYIPQAFNHVKSFNWDRNLFKANELQGMTLGIIGFGRIGNMLGKYCMSLGMKIIYYDSDSIKNSPISDNCYPVDLKELLSISDIISIHIDSGFANNNFLDKQKLKLIKDGCYIVNTSRGNIIDEDAVLELLEAKILRGYAADVISGEEDSISSSNLIQNIDKYNIIVTPHIGGCTFEAMEKTEEAVAMYCCREFLDEGSWNSSS